MEMDMEDLELLMETEGGGDLFNIGGENTTGGFLLPPEFQMDANIQALTKAVEILNIFAVPLLIFIGILGNTLSLLVFTCTHIRLQSSSIYLAFLNASDTGFLIALFVIWLGYVNVHLFHVNVICQTVIYTSYVCSFLSVWTVVSFTLERYIVVFYPLKKHRLCTQKRARFVVIGLLVLALLLYSYSTWTAGMLNIGGTQICMIRPPYFSVVRVMSSIDTIITLVIPSLLIIFVNAAITFKICEFFGRKRPMNWSSYQTCTTSAGGGGIFCDPPQQAQLQNRLSARSRSSRGSNMSNNVQQRQYHLLLRRHVTTVSTSNIKHNFQVRTTRTLVIVSTVFVVLNLPSHAFRVHAFVMHLKDPNYKYSPAALLWQNILQILYYINFAVNFFLYSACSKSFRQALKRLLGRMKYALQNKFVKLFSLFGLNVCTAATEH